MRSYLYFSCVFISHLFISSSFAAFDSAKFNAADIPLEIQRITPSGRDVHAGHQLVFQFNQPVVPVGKMDRQASEIPITIAPALNCQWRWLNTSALACQLDNANHMKPATRYRILVQTGIKTEAGKTLAKPKQHSFITRRPKVSYSRFETWTAAGMPYLRVSFNQAVSQASVEKSLFFKVNGKITVPVQVLDAKTKIQPERDVALVLPLEGNTSVIVTKKKAADTQTEASQKNKQNFARIWLLKPQKMFPLNANIQLRVKAGLRAKKGAENGIERRVVSSFDSFPAFRFLGVKCENNKGNSLRFQTAQPLSLSAHQRCNPLSIIGLVFSAPVPIEEIKNHLTMQPSLSGNQKDYDPWADVYRSSALGYSHKKDKTYIRWFPDYLKAWQTYSLQANTQNLKDFFGRSLAQPINLQFATNHRKPNYHFAHNTTVLESGVDSQIPLVVTNLEHVRLRYNLLSTTGVQNNLSAKQDVPAVVDVAFKMPLTIRELLPKTSGVVQGTFETMPPVRNDYYNDRWFFSQVTPYQMQVKVGHFNTLVWITRFADGLPVEGVDVSVYVDTYGQFNAKPDVLAKVVTNAEGVAILPGIKTLDPQLKYQSYRRNKPRLFIRAQKAKNIALLALDSHFSVGVYDVTDYEFGNWQRKQYGHMHSWGTTAQGVYKVGDTIQYKVLLRDQNNTGFIAPPTEGYQLSITDPTGKVIEKLKNISLSEFGSYAGEYTLSKNAAVGWYDFELKANYQKSLHFSPMRVLVSDFTPSPFRVSNTLNGNLFKIGDILKVETQATLHAGGPYVDAQTQLYVKLEEQSLSPASPTLRGFQFDTHTPDGYSDTIHHGEGELNKKGIWQTELTLADDLPVLYGKLRVESTVRDDRGKEVASRSQAQYVGRDRFVGLKSSNWVFQQNVPADVLISVVDEHAKAIAGTSVSLSIQHRVTKAARVKGAGNAYLTQYKQEWVDEGESCAVVSSKQIQNCVITPQHAGLYRFTARIKDSQQREHQTIMTQWVSGSSAIVWENDNNNRLVIEPEKTDYQVGDTARYLIKNPFPHAQALVTIERYGILKSWVQTLNNSIEILEFEVEPDFIPGFFVSVTVMSPRVDKPLGAGKIDLGKPAFRMGYVKTTVRDPYKELQVTVKPEHAVYKPRDTVTVNIQAQARQADVPIEPMEIAVVVLDEAVFDLISQGRAYFDPYKGFYTLDDLDVSNYNLLIKLLGRQKFEKKGANPGGDGGGSQLSLRSVFKFVSYWNPTLKTDKEGKAQIQFEVPDNLTGWRVLAMAVTPNQRMGLGDANFKVNRPLELRPIMPNQVTTGDNFQAGFSVMNRTDETLTVTLDIEAVQPESDTESKTQTLEAKPYQRYSVWLPVKAKIDGKIVFNARATACPQGKTCSKTETITDALEHSLKVYKRRNLQTAATYGTTTQDNVTESVHFPDNIHGDAGSLSVIAMPSVIGGVAGAFSYMRDYPYVCWEQRLSVGTMASHYNSLRDWLPEDLVWDNSKTLPTQALSDAVDFQAPNGGMAFWNAYDERVSPYLSAYTGLAFNWLRNSGHEIPKNVEDKLHEYLQTLLRRNVLPDFYSKGMASSVRAVALAALAPHKKIEVGDIHRYASHIDEMSLFGKAHFLDAALYFDDTETVRKTVVDKILGQANQSGGKITFNEELDDAYSRIMTSPLRDNCAVLGALLRYEETPNTRSTGLPFKLVRSITQARKGRTHWENTQENMYCMNALINYARIYEKDSAKMTVKVTLDKTEVLGKAQFNSMRDAQASFVHSITADDVGRKAQLDIERIGTGRLYYGVRLQYAPTAAASTRVNAGFDIRREYSVERAGKWVLLKNPIEIQSGELIRIDLFLNLPSARNFVVVDDPIPGGLEPVNRDLATASLNAADKAESDHSGGSFWYQNADWHTYDMSFWSFYHKELRHHAARFYADYLPKGNYHLSYVAQAIAGGQFSVLPTHVEEMYEPDVYGQSLPRVLNVEIRQ